VGETRRSVAWVKEEPFGVEFAEIDLAPERLAAKGVAIGVEPLSYRLDYTLETETGFVTSRLHVVSRGESWRRSLGLRHAEGAWTIDADQEGDVALTPAGGDPASLSGALDCDLGLSPVTNLMPVLRHDLLSGRPAFEITTAWVSVPDLSVRADGQRYSFVRDGVIRFEATDGSFAADITLDEDGIVVDYPGIARRLPQPPRERLRELSDFAAPWGVWIAATLRLPDHIRAGTTQLDDLAERTGADPDALHRLLRYLVARGVFAEEGGDYANSDVSELLLDEAGWRRWLDLDGAPGLWAESWTRLLQAIRTGSPGRDDLWYVEELARTGTGESFDALMAAQVRANAEQVAEAYDWGAVEHVVDVGGGTGVMLRTLLAAHPHLRATLFDLPQVVESAEQAERLDVVAGNFFDDPLPAADAYVLSQILHGWPDERAGQILRRCVEAGGDEVRILLVEGVIPDHPTAGDASFDLFMLTLGGGRQRTLGEFKRLAESVDLELRSSRLLDTGDSVLELRG
jgi:2,7-dihydroxy-5-methyl-1-naphthoate 7-O-methyltransferase